MGNKAIRSMVGMVLLIMLAWVGIALSHWLHGSRLKIPGFLLWGAVLVTVVYFTLFHAFTGRSERMGRGSSNSAR